ncbi:hypothetical protein PV04_00790 [Phialophora macrospora]|uniref:Uncharacterized protein n=1 Tax=Phialophora macrospora TaxID=1851006 RepID=A0A0D2FVX3_9EURO|nr:hypothetical protein PV04_00790 [Phialophora macrospora]
MAYLRDLKWAESVWQGNSDNLAYSLTQIRRCPETRGSSPWSSSHVCQEDLPHGRDPKSSSQADRNFPSEPLTPENSQRSRMQILVETRAVLSTIEVLSRREPMSL